MRINWYDVFWKRLDGWLLEELLDRYHGPDEWRTEGYVTLKGTQGKDWAFMILVRELEHCLSN